MTNIELELLAFRITTLCIPILSTLLLTACDNTVSWREEVKLRTGEVITVDREALHVNGGGEWAAGGQRSYPIKYFIRFKQSTKAAIPSEWQSKDVDLSLRQQVELPLVLDINQANTWFMYTIRWMNEYCIRYVTYQYEQGKWVEKPYSDQPIETHETNMFINAYSNKLSGTINLIQKNQDNSKGSFLWYDKQVGPKQLIGSHKILTCQYDAATQQFIPKRIDGDKK